MKSHEVLKRNIKAILHARGLKPKDLAMFCRRSEAWLSQLFKPDRNIPLKYIDRFAEFFGLEAYTLFQPGIDPYLERRQRGERRSGGDRRVSSVSDALRETPSMASLEARMRQLTPEAYRRFAKRVEAALTLAEPSGAAPPPPDLPAISGPPSGRSPRTRAAPFRIQKKKPTADA